MFKNVGAEMKAYAEATARGIQVRYGLVSAVVTLLGFVLAPALDSVAVIIIGVIVAGCIFWHGYQKSRLTVMQLYAFGELVERVTSIESGLGRKPSPKPVSKPNKKEKGDSVPVMEPLAKSVIGWVCPFCDHHNPAGTESCESCGIAHEYE